MTKARASYERKSHKKTKASTRPSGLALAASAQFKRFEPDMATGVLTYSPSLQLVTISLAEFMSSYVPQSPYDYLTDISSSEALEISLCPQIQAASLAMAACKLKDFRILAASRNVYATALSNTNIALRHPNTAIRDSTLVSVLLLGLYEALSCQITGVSNDWAKHTAGAVALLRLRGEGQFASKLGRRLFDQVCSILCFDTMVRRVSMLPEMLDLISIADTFQHRTPKSTFVEIIGQVASSPCLLWDDDIHPEARLTKALMLDRSVIQYTKELPLDHQYTQLVVSHNKPKSGWETYGHTIHQFQHTHAARIWNACMVIRIQLQSIIHKTLSQSPPTKFPKPEDRMSALRQAEQDIARAAATICASVPQILSPVEYDKIGIQVSHEDRKSTRLNSSHSGESRMPSSA